MSLTAGTILHNTKTPLTVWCWATYLMVTDKRGIPGLLLQRQLGLSRYETAWMLLHKLRRAMVNAGREPWYGVVDIDDTWTGGPQPSLRSSRQLKGRRAAIALVAVEKRGHTPGRIRMAMVRDFKQTTMLAAVMWHVTPGSTIYTDGLKGFERVPAAGVRHVARTQPLRIDLRKGTPSVVPLADRANGNLQQWLIDRSWLVAPVCPHKAGALRYYGRALGLSPATSQHNNFYLWGPGNPDAMSSSRSASHPRP